MWASIEANREAKNCGVPQVSILEPPLVILLIDDMPKMNEHTDAYFHAADTAIISQSEKSILIENHKMHWQKQKHSWTKANWL